MIIEGCFDDSLQRPLPEEVVPRAPHVMLMMLIVETSVIIFLLVTSNLSRQVFPSLDLYWNATPGCTGLIARVVSTTGNSRTVEYSCSGGGALNIKPARLIDFSRYGSGPAVTLAIPTFSLPKGYFGLSLVDRACGCIAGRQVPLKSGQNMTLGSGADFQLYVGSWSYDYCANIAGQSGHTDGFTISWSELPWPTEFVKLSASPSQLVVPAGQNASTIVTLAAQGYFSGNVTFAANGEHGSGSNQIPPTWTISPSRIFLVRGGTNSTAITLIAPQSASQTFILALYAYPGSGTAAEYAYLRANLDIPMSIV